MNISTEPSVKNYSLNACERETIVSMCDDVDYAEIYTCQRKVITKCEAQGYTLIKQDKWSKTYRCPIRCISFRNVTPRKVKKGDKDGDES